MRISDWSSDVCSSDLPEWDAPFLQEWNDPTWTHWTFDDLGKIDVHPQEIVDNITDAAHFGPVHGSKTKFFENEFAGHLAIQRMGGGHRTLVAEGGPMLVTEAVDRKSVAEGKSVSVRVDLGGRRIIKKKNHNRK